MQSEDDERKLARYETAAYRVTGCVIRFTEGAGPREVLGRTFQFAGDPAALKEKRVVRE